VQLLLWENLLHDSISKAVLSFRKRLKTRVQTWRCRTVNNIYFNSKSVYNCGACKLIRWRHISCETSAISCHHAQAICHIRYLLTPELAQTLACSVIFSRIDYCNALLCGIPTGNIQKLQCVQNNTDRIVLQMPRRSRAKPLLHSLHWLPVDQRWRWSHSKFSAPQRQHRRHLRPSNCVRNLQSSDTPLLCQPFTKTDLARRGFCYSAPAVWNSLPS